MAGDRDGAGDLGLLAVGVVVVMGWVGWPPPPPSVPPRVPPAVPVVLDQTERPLESVLHWRMLDQRWCGYGDGQRFATVAALVTHVRWVHGDAIADRFSRWE